MTTAIVAEDEPAQMNELVRLLREHWPELHIAANARMDYPLWRHSTSTSLTWPSSTSKALQESVASR